MAKYFIIYKDSNVSNKKNTPCAKACNIFPNCKTFSMDEEEDEEKSFSIEKVYTDNQTTEIDAEYDANWAHVEERHPVTLQSFTSNHANRKFQDWFPKDPEQHEQQSLLTHFLKSFPSCEAVSIDEEEEESPSSKFQDWFPQREKHNNATLLEKFINDAKSLESDRLRKRNIGYRTPAKRERVNRKIKTFSKEKIPVPKRQVFLL